MKKSVKKVSAKPKLANVKKSAKKSTVSSSPPKKKVAKKVVKKKTAKHSEATAKQPIRGNTAVEPRLYLERAGRVMTFREAEAWSKANPPPPDSKPSFGTTVSTTARPMATTDYDKRYGKDGK